jgi:hypothetical protein
MEHRQGSRRRALALVKIQCQNNNGTGFVYNISRDGLFIVSDIKTKINDIVDINLSLPRMGKMSAHIPGMVVHCRKHGFGIMFRSLDSRTLKIVNKFLNKTQRLENNSSD